MRESTIEIIKATAPVLQSTATVITTRFYGILLDTYPQFRPLFNRSHQHSGLQAHALADARVAFATYVQTPEVLGDAIRRIAHRHASLDVQRQQYDIVGHCLLRAIDEVLGDAATVEILSAWGEAYDYLATILIEQEEGIYQHNEHEPGGWRGPRRFEVARIEPESSMVRSFYLAPVDGGPIMPFEAGQYLTVLLGVDGEDLRRNYSISCASGLDHYRITIKRDPQGVVSRYFHDQVKVGHPLEVLPPCGDFVLDSSDDPLVLVSAGVGITPTISMLDTAIASGREILFLHAAHSGREHAFCEHVVALAAEHPQLRYAFIYEQPDPGDTPQSTGLVDRTFLSRHIDRTDVQVYFVGPKPFMETVLHHTQRIGIPAGRVHFEFFGPHQQLATLAPDDVKPARPHTLALDASPAGLERRSA